MPMNNILKPSKNRILILSISTAILFCSISSYSLFADVIHLKNGNAIEGIILETQEDKVIIKVDIGTITFSTDDIETIERSSAEEKEVLDEKWSEQKKRREIEDAEKRKQFEKERAFEKIKETTEKAKKEISQHKKKALSVPLRINWVSYNMGLRAARNSGKPIMIDFYTSWCGWCKKLDKETFKDETVRALSTQFVCIKVNADTSKSLTKKYGVRGYPTVVFLNSSGKQIGKIGGFKPAKAFAAQMKQYLK
jgi:thiol-disulfide isomerase/thioredoxin